MPFSFRYDDAAYSLTVLHEKCHHLEWFKDEFSFILVP